MLCFPDDWEGVEMWDFPSSLPHNPPSSALVSDWQVRWAIGNDRPRFKGWCNLIINRWLPKSSTSWDGCLKETLLNLQLLFIPYGLPGILGSEPHWKACVSIGVARTHQLVLISLPPTVLKLLNLCLNFVEAIDLILLKPCSCMTWGKKSWVLCLVMNKWANDSPCFPT